MPRWLVVAFNVGFSAVLLLAVFQLLLDMATGLAMLVRWQRVGIPPGVRYALGGCALLLAAVGVIQAMRVPPLKDVEIEIANLPPQFEGYRLLQLTDLHISRLFDAAWARGDVAALADLQAPDGVYVIPGNHEYFFGYQSWMDHFPTLGMKPVANSHASLERDGAKLVLAGVTDYSATSIGLPGPDLRQALAGAPADVPVILLDHQPRKARLAAAQGVGLQLSGHTHGGLIAGIDRLFALANEGFVSGPYDVQGMQLYVNNGTALWPGLALRLGRPSELTRITLKRKRN